MERYPATEVFTPTTPAKLTFVERDEINEQLVDALRTPGKQVVVYGPSGSGKTTLLLNKLNQLYADHVTVRCTNSTTYDQMLLDAFDQLNTYYIDQISKKDAQSVKASLSADYMNIKSQLEASRTEENSSSQKRAVPLQLTPARLAEFLGEAGSCLVLEDFHKVQGPEKTRLAQTMKVFMDSAVRWPTVKVIAIGAVDTARDVIEYEPEMQNRVAEVNVPIMSSQQVRTIIDKGEDLLNLDVPGHLKDAFANYSCGLASVAHQLCLNICFAAGIYETCDECFAIGPEHLEKAVERYLADTSDSMKAAFDKALRRTRTRKFDNCRLIIRALTSLEKEKCSFNEILQTIRKWHKDYPSGNLTQYLASLQKSERGELVSYDSVSNFYSFAKPIYRSYALLLFASEPKAADKIAARITEISNSVLPLRNVLELAITGMLLDKAAKKDFNFPQKVTLAIDTAKLMKDLFAK